MSVVKVKGGWELLNATVEDNYRGDNRVIYIPPENSKARIPIYKPIPPEMYGYFDKAAESQKYLFFEGNRPDRERINYSFRYACNEAGLGKDVVLYTLRHTAITKLVNKGNDHFVIAAVCGWTSPDQLKTYYHLNKLEAARKLLF